MALDIWLFVQLSCKTDKDQGRRGVFAVQTLSLLKSVEFKMQGMAQGFEPCVVVKRERKFYFVCQKRVF